MTSKQFIIEVTLFSPAVIAHHPREWSSIQIVLRRLLWSTARPGVLLRNQIPRSTAFDAQEAFVRVGFTVATANWFVVLLTNSVAAFKGESRQTSLEGNDENVFAAIVLSHLTFRLVQSVIAATNKVCRLIAAVSFTELSFRTVARRNRNYSKTTSSLLHLASGTINVSVRRANRLRFRIVDRAGFAFNFLLETCARPDVRQLNASPGIVKNDYWMLRTNICDLTCKSPSAIHNHWRKSWRPFRRFHLSLRKSNWTSSADVCMRFRSFSCSARPSSNISRSEWLEHFSSRCCWRKCLFSSNSHQIWAESHPQLSIFSSHSDV